MERGTNDGAEHLIVQLDGGGEAEEEKMGGRNSGKDKKTANETREDVDARRSVYSILPGGIVVVHCDG